MGREQKYNLRQMKERVEIYILSQTRAAKYYNIQISHAENIGIFHNEQNLITRVTAGHYLFDLEKVCSPEERKQIRDVLMRKAELWYELRDEGASFPPDKMKMLIELESASFHGGAQRYLEELSDELGILKREPAREKTVEMDRSTRLQMELNQFILATTPAQNYYNLENSHAQNLEILQQELKRIEKAFTVYFTRSLQEVFPLEEKEQMRTDFIKRAVLLHELREEGASFPPDKMKMLIKLESGFYGNKMKEHLERINKKLGIIRVEGALFTAAQPREKKLHNPIERLALKDWGVTEIRASAEKERSTEAQDKGTER